MKIAIVSPTNTLTSLVYSHRSAPAVIYCNQLREMGHDAEVDFEGKIEDLNEYDEVYMFHADNGTSRAVPGAMNIFGGFQNCPYSQNVVKVSKYKGKIYSLNCDFPEYDRLLKRKFELAKKNNTYIEPIWHELDIENWTRFRKEAKTVHHINPSKKLVIGDSHAICMYRPGWSFNSVVFKTLNGALNIGLKNLVDIDGVEELEFYFGNIDVRHHLCRIEGDHLKNAEALADRYIAQAKELGAKIYELLPIENESRVVPKTGHYDDKPFWGSWAERKRVRDHFNDYIEYKYGIIRWTNYLLNDKGELDFKYMEKPRSVHLSREYYPYWNGIENNEKSVSLEDFFA